VQEKKRAQGGVQQNKQKGSRGKAGINKAQGGVQKKKKAQGGVQE
jgi:hypothetical protein